MRLHSCSCFLQGWEFSGFRQNSGFSMVPKVILEICLTLGRQFCVYVYLTTLSFRRPALKPRFCLPFYLDWVCPQLARRRTVRKWPSVVCIWAFPGGLQARWWQAKLGLQSFINLFLACGQRVPWENLFALQEVHHVVPRNRVFHNLDLEKAFSFRGLCPQTPTRALPLEPLADLPTRLYLTVWVRKSVSNKNVWAYFSKYGQRVSRQYGNRDVNKCKFIANVEHWWSYRS